MIPKSILFYWSKGAEMRRNILLMIKKANEANKPCFLNLIAKKLNLTHTAVKKHIDLLAEEKYVSFINPKGKPVFLKLTKTGEDIVNEFKEKKER